MDIAEYKRLYGGNDDAAPGWDAINVPPQRVRRAGTAALGQPHQRICLAAQTLDGIALSMSAATVARLICTSALTGIRHSTNDEESVGGECSRFGFEMTFRLASPLPPREELYWVLNLLNNLARYVFEREPLV